MKRNLTKSSVLLLIGALLGAGLVASLDAAQEYRPITGYAFWSQADDHTKTAYLIGYSDAEQMYRLILDKGVKTRCGDAGKAWIEEVDRKILAPDNITFRQAFDGINEFYKDWKNQGVHLFLVHNIVRMQVAGKPQAEIEEAIRKARTASNPSNNE